MCIQRGGLIQFPFNVDTISIQFRFDVNTTYTLNVELTSRAYIKVGSTSSLDTMLIHRTFIHSLSIQRRQHFDVTQCAFIVNPASRRIRYKL